MTLKIDFNHHQILRGHLEQLIPQMDLQDISSRIHIGNAGGAGYALFKDPFYYANLVNTFEAIEEIQKFFGVVNVYLSLAEEHALRFGFRLLDSNGSSMLREKTPHSEVFTMKYHSHSAWGLVIGDTNIESIDRLVRFLEMVKEGKPVLDQPYEAVKTAGKRYLQ